MNRLLHLVVWATEPHEERSPASLQGVPAKRLANTRKNSDAWFRVYKARRVRWYIKTLRKVEAEMRGEGSGE